MTNRSRFAFVSVPLLLAGFVLGAQAQTKAPSSEQPMSGKDRTSVEAAFSSADANADGKLTKDEAMKLPAIAAKFSELDKDKDGVLSSGEFSAGVTVGN